MSYQSAWRSPSNIALVKYWGKKQGGVQLPANPSISFTLDQCHTETRVEWASSSKGSIELWLEEEKRPDFLPKINQLIKRLGADYQFLTEGQLKIRTSNSFPHSSGIASSASSMSALALCFFDLQCQVNGLELDMAKHLKEISRMARLGSGSASRSLFSDAAIWGTHEDVEGSSDEFAIPFQELHPVFQDFRDTILIVEEGQKSVSSTAGHQLLEGHPYAVARYKQANENLIRMTKALKNGDLREFASITESEAMTLHAMMMSSDPWFILMKPNTLHLIEKIKTLREHYQLNMVITLDAGANIHLLYPGNESAVIEQLIQNKLSIYCQDGMYICDRIGKGPTRL